MSSERFIPALRKDLELEVFSKPEVGSGATLVAQVIDHRLRRRLKLDRTALALYRLIDGVRDIDEIDEALRREGTLVSPHLLAKVLEFFETNLLIDRSHQADTLAAAGQELPASGTYTLRSRSAETPRKVRFLQETRHTCVGSGQCCRGYHFGPLSEEETTRLSTETFEEEGDRINESRKVIECEIEGKVVPVLETREDGRCTFLSEDNLCIIHKEKGADAKPWMCQAFPLRFIGAPDGRVFGHLQMECFGYHEGRKKARPYAERTEEVERTMRVAGPILVMRRSTRIGEDRELDFAEYEEIERWILEAFRENLSAPGMGLVTAAQLLRHLEDGGELQSFSPRLSAFPEDGAEFTRAVAAFALENAGQPATTIGGELIGPSPELRRWFADALNVFRGEGDPRELLAIADVADVCQDHECAEILTEFLRNEVFSKEWYRAGDLRHGLALTVTRYVITLAGSRMQARRWADKRVSPRALTHALSSVVRNLRTLHIESFADRCQAELVEIYTSFTRSC